ncbi:MAG: hypothetical protein F6K50_02720 [Moorea sp. SIO3I7]|uniref:hypothetical protein n=1 Tax=Moorena sp. SIO3I8 TaxID=2607833 RepID=UPI0013BF8A0A|nr:hypothetical protein [Moorena sp. SIO3I8]NEN94475.1 hypothetical protein [Moorena sp. SIO3I7]NEO04921.1 hypothetical protein [Moorena sp. SIO3I8]
MSWKLEWNLPSTKTMVARYSWTTDYVVFVHEGAVLRNGTRIPARPWTWVAIAEYDFRHQFAFFYNRSGTSLGDAMVSTATEFGGVMQDAIASPIWKWDNVTVRKSGEIAYSPRNILDTKELYNSYNLVFVR